MHVRAWVGTVVYSRLCAPPAWCAQAACGGHATSAGLCSGRRDRQRCQQVGGRPWRLAMHRLCLRVVNTRTDLASSLQPSAAKLKAKKAPIVATIDFCCARHPLSVLAQPSECGQGASARTTYLCCLLAKTLKVSRHKMQGPVVVNRKGDFHTMVICELPAELFANTNKQGCLLTVIWSCERQFDKAGS